MKKYLELIGGPTKWKCLGIILMTLIGSALMSLVPVQLGQITTAVTSEKFTSITQLIAAVAVYGLIYLAAEYSSTARRVFLDCIIAAHEEEIRGKSIEKLLKMPISYYSAKPGEEEKLSGERTAQLNQGVAGLSQLIKIFCNDICAAVLTAVCTLYQTAVNAPFALASIMLLYLLLTTAVSIFQIQSQNGVRENIIKQKNALDGQVCQSIANLELIRSMNASEYERGCLKPTIAKIGTTEKRHHRYMGFFDSIKQSCKVIAQVALLLVSGAMILAGRMPPGGAITVCLLFQQLVKPIDEVYRFMDETATSTLKAKALFDVMSKDQDPVFSLVSVNHERMNDEIFLEDAVITDPTGERILAMYDELHIPCNSIVAVIGDSGCGKTSLARCLNRYYLSLAKRISLWGHDQVTYSQQELTDRLLYIPQKAFFFAGTIRENLVYGLSRPVSNAELIEALRSACLYESLAARVQNGSRPAVDGVLAYRIGEGGTGLSGGEGQRLSLARTFLRTPWVFILDESTTGLDDGTVNNVLDHLEAYAASIGAGIIYISHDERVTKRCRHIIKLHNKVNYRAERTIA